MYFKDMCFKNMHPKPVTASLRFDMLFLALTVAFVGIVIAGRL